MSTRMLMVGAWIAWTAVCLASSGSWSTDATIRQNMSPHVGQPNIDISPDGRFVAFVSWAALLPHGASPLAQVYVLDRTTRQLTLESLSIDGAPPNGSSEHPRLSGDGRYLVFSSVATNLTERPTEAGAVNVFLRDRWMQKTVVMPGASQCQGIDSSHRDPDISDDGASVVFESSCTGLVAGPDRNGSLPDVYLFDVERRTIERVSVDSDGRQLAEGSSGYPGVNRDGRYVTFTSSALLGGVDAHTSRTAVVGRQPAAGNHDVTAAQVHKRKPRHVFVRDRVRGTTTLVSRRPDGRAPNASSFHSAISADGRLVVFVSHATDLGESDRNRAEDVYLYDTVAARTTLVSRSAQGGSGDGRSFDAAISIDGRHIVFASEASDLVCGRRCAAQTADVNLVADVYRFDVLARSIERVSGAAGRGPPWWEASRGPAVDGTGELIAFSSRHPIDATDFGHDFDLFVSLRTP